MRSTLVHSVDKRRVRSRALKLCLGFRLFTAKPSAVRTRRNHCGQPEPRARSAIHGGKGSAYVVDFAPVIFENNGPRGPGESSKKQLGDAFHRVGRRPVRQSRAAGGNVEAKEVFHRSQVGRLDTRL